MTRRAATLRPMLMAAMRAAEVMPAAEKADVYEGIAIVAKRHDAALSSQAANFAKSLRDAEALQLHFRHLLTEIASEA